MTKRSKNLFAKTAFATTLAVGLLLPSASYAATTSQIVVKPNDTMYKIAKSNGVSLDALIKANPQVKNPNVIWPGMSLNLPESSATPSQPSKPDPALAEDNSFASQVVNLVNKERAKEGLKPLTTDAKLTTVALDKAKDMYNNHYFDHNSPTYGSPFDMMKQYGVRYSYAGENIAKGQRTPQEVMKSWMNSSGHRKNIMSANFTKIGVGYYNGEWVQEFIG
ncbi:CAP domain-containing protein [Paenibacillus larvae]|uniref:CAP domain-containing protein n=1 Tax=Paenibacillus larvae TaxID=1464 RepID=UPI00227E6F8F|nr:CAP domain-containing protein [Paenibacillus larvae]MCY9510386.1 CAP domain-containing protein [Paenibacillus larvae]MCY9526659.1 CAP domain-containing protein [Paenibacillus larvae]